MSTVPNKTTNYARADCIFVVLNEDLYDDVRFLLQTCPGDIDSAAVNEMIQLVTLRVVFLNNSNVIHRLTCYLSD